MAAPTPEDIVTWAERKATPSHTRTSYRLTQEEVGLLLKLRQDGLTQTEIAQRLGVDQAAVSRWLSKLTDTTDVAKSYLAGAALTMAQNIVKRGLPRDHIAALKGIGVLEQEQSTTQIGIALNLPGLTFASPDATVSADIHRLTVDTGSDK